MALHYGMDSELIAENSTERPDRIKVLFFSSYPLTNPNCSRMPTLKPSARCPRPGLAVELIELIARTINVTMEVEMDHVGRHHYGEISNGTYDLFGVIVQYTKLRAQAFDLTIPLFEDAGSMIAVRRNNESFSGVFDFFKVFPLLTWLLIAATFFSHSALAMLARVAENRAFRRKWNNGAVEDLADLLFSMIRFQLRQPVALRFQFVSGNLSTLLFALLQCTILCELYRSWILSTVVQPKNARPFEAGELARVLAEGRYHLMRWSEDWFFDEIRTSTNSPFPELRAALRQNPYRQAESLEDMVEAAVNRKGLLLFDDQHPLAYLTHDVCDLVTIPGAFPPTRPRFLMRKGHPLLEPINEAIRQETVRIWAITHKYSAYKPPSRCAAPQRRHQSLSFYPFIGVFVLLLIGFSCGGWALAVEWRWAARKRRQIGVANMP